MTMGELTFQIDSVLMTIEEVIILIASVLINEVSSIKKNALYPLSNCLNLINPMITGKQIKDSQKF